MMRWVPREGMMLRIVAAAVVLLMSASCADDEDEPPGRLGDPAVYDRIDSMTDCLELRVMNNSFQAAAEYNYHNDRKYHESMSYAHAVFNRMIEVGCHPE